MTWPPSGGAHPAQAPPGRGPALPCREPGGGRKAGRARGVAGRLEVLRASCAMRGSARGEGACLKAPEMCLQAARPRAPFSFSLSFLFMGCFLGSRHIALQGLVVVPVSSVSKSVGRGGEERLGQTLWIAVAFGVGFPIHRAALVTGRHEGSTTTHGSFLWELVGGHIGDNPRDRVSSS